MPKNLLPAALLVALVSSCAPSARLNLRYWQRNVAQNPVFAQSFVGFSLYDLDGQKTVYAHNESRYFTPASNTKILTFYASLRTLGDSLPALRYVRTGDSLLFWGTGDPSFLHPDLGGTRAYDFLRSQPEKLFYVAAPYADDFFGAGWAWDDYNDSPERSAFPLYANVVRFSVAQKSPLRVQPAYFAPNVGIGLSKQYGEPFVKRQFAASAFTYYPWAGATDFNQEVPFRTSTSAVAQLLRDTLKRDVGILPNLPQAPAQTLYSLPADSVYKRMMQESDNFLAEQLLLLQSSVRGDTLGTGRSIAYAQANFLADLPDAPVWADGSGLSRYNLCTPRTLVALWRKVYQAVPRQRLFALLATGGRAGTLKNLYKQYDPFIFGKTGTLRNNHCLSGYLVTRSNKTLVFSFMHSNFTLPTAQIRQEMERILTQVYERY